MQFVNILQLKNNKNLRLNKKVDVLNLSAI